jgi:hypothetical protein
MEKFRQNQPIEVFAHEPRPKKKIRGCVHAILLLMKTCLVSDNNVDYLVEDLLFNSESASAPGEINNSVFHRNFALLCQYTVHAISTIFTQQPLLISVGPFWSLASMLADK